MLFFINKTNSVKHSGRSFGQKKMNYIVTQKYV